MGKSWEMPSGGYEGDSEKKETPWDHLEDDDTEEPRHDVDVQWVLDHEADELPKEYYVEPDAEPQADDDHDIDAEIAAIKARAEAPSDPMEESIKESIDKAVESARNNPGNTAERIEKSNRLGEEISAELDEVEREAEARLKSLESLDGEGESARPELGTPTRLSDRYSQEEIKSAIDKLEKSSELGDQIAEEMEEEARKAAEELMRMRGEGNE